VAEQSLQLDDLLVPDVVPDGEDRAVGPEIGILDPMLVETPADPAASSAADYADTDQVEQV
jgi:hypothetical protein